MANNINMHVLHDKLAETFETLYETQKENITKAAELCADAIEMGGVIQVFGSGHSVGFGMEMRNRPGSLVPVHSMVMNDFVIKGIVDLKTFKSQDDIFERKPGIADKLYNLYRTDDNDVFIIISNSGINGVVIDLAIYAKQTGHKVIVVTSWEHTNSENSRHPSGKKLYEVADVVLDNCSPGGDGCLNINGYITGAVSSIASMFILNTITSEAIKIVTDKGFKPYIFQSQNVDGFNNDAIYEHYRGRVKHLY